MGMEEGIFQPHRCKTADYLEGVKSGCFDLSNACDCFGGIPCGAKT